MTANVKTCTQCKVAKPITDFYHSNVSPRRGQPARVAVQSECKECGKARNRNRYRTNPQARVRAREQDRIRRADPAEQERRRQYYRDWKARNRERVLQYRQEYAPLYRSRQMELYRLKTYGVTQAEFDAMLAYQERRCWICRTPFSLDRLLIHLDHDHNTGMLRGLLCSPCNRGCGDFRDDPKRVAAAARYLRLKAHEYPAQQALQMMTWSEHGSNAVRSAEQETTDPIAS